MAKRIPRLPLKPSLPPGMTFGDFGKVIKWGSGDKAARKRARAITLKEIDKIGLTIAMAREWRDFYSHEIVRNPTNPSATGRKELMDRIIDMIDGREAPGEK